VLLSAVDSLTYGRYSPVGRRERVERRLAAILAADVVGYTRLMGADETGTLRRLTELRQEVLEPLIAAHHGRVVKLIGDGLLVEFASIVDAVTCAVAWQNGVAAREGETDEDKRFQFRIGINLGDVIIEGDDIHGDGVNIAARLEGQAEPGGICLSGDAYRQAKGKVEVDFADLGEQDLKNVAEPVRIYRIAGVNFGTGAASPAREPLLLLDKPSIAVLPFTNMSGDPDQEYFSEGLTEDIITALSQWRSFPVVARHSTFAFKGKAVRVQKIGAELGARYILEGGVRKAGGRVRVTVQLIDAQTGHHVWAQKLDSDIEDIFAVQDEITRRIVATVVPELEKVETKRSVAKQLRNLDAWDCYLHGLSFLHQSTRQGNVRAREMFERAIELDPAFSPAFTGMSYILNRDLLLDDARSFDATAAKCLEAAERAVELDGESSLTRTALVRALLWCGQHVPAIEEANRALELNHYDALAHFWLGAALSFAGRPEEGIPRLETALELAPHDPRKTIFMTHLALACLTTGQLDRALGLARAAARPRSDFVEAPLVLASVLSHLGKVAEARTVADGIAIADLGAVARRPFWRRYRYPETRERVLDGLRKAGLSE
jgi:adenylate cyclase